MTLLVIHATKRAIDLVVASVAIVLTLPLFPVLALAIVIDSPGPVFYRQRRALRVLGRDELGALRVECFHMWKLRTMHVDAERDTGPVLARERDPRVTRVGSFLRRTRLDELPQLVHVLLGQMSLVGPRPERPELVATLADRIPLFEERARGLKPGITGLAQVSLRYAGEPPPGSPVRELFGPCSNEDDAMRVKLAFDMAYAAATSSSIARFLRVELGILARTPLVMLRGLGR